MTDKVIDLAGYRLQLEIKKLLEELSAYDNHTEKEGE